MVLKAIGTIIPRPIKFLPLRMWYSWLRDESDDVEVTHPAPLEGECETNSKQTSGDSGNGTASNSSNSDHSPEKETNNAYQSLGNDQVTFLCNHWSTTNYSITGVHTDQRSGSTMCQLWKNLATSQLIMQ